MEGKSIVSYIGRPVAEVNKIIEKILNRYLLGIFIAKAGGEMLYCFQIDDSIRSELFAQFIAALSMFGEENMGKISRIQIKGLDIEMSIFSRYNLILTVLFRPNMVQEYLEEESERLLDAFYQEFRDPLEKGKINQAIYERFDKITWEIVKDYLVRIGVIKDIVGLSTDLDFMVG